MRNRLEEKLDIHYLIDLDYSVDIKFYRVYREMTILITPKPDRNHP